MAVFVLVVGFFGVILTKNNISKVSESLKSINLPKIDFDLADFRSDLPNVNFSNVSPGDLGIMLQDDAKLGNVTSGESGGLFKNK